MKHYTLKDTNDEINHPYLTTFYRVALIFVVLLVVFITILHTQPSLHQKYHQIFYNVEIYLFGIMFFDFLLRLISAIKHYNTENIQEYNYKNSLSKYIFSFFGIIDLISSIPFFMRIFGFQNDDIVTILSMISLLKIARYSPALIVLKDVIINEKSSLFAAFYLMIILTLSLSTILYFIERDVNPDGFGSLLKSIWWSVVTLATVGYGDVVPQTWLGKLVGGMASITGFGMFALPAGILASGFSEEIKRLRDITNWKVVAKVPLFHNLEFGAIADISKLLHIKRFRKYDLIIKEGDTAQAMYFIVEGNVRVTNAKGLNTQLQKGDFFGEIALIKNVPRTATIIAENRCKLLELTTYDFRNFIKTKPELLQTIKSVANQRFD